jgi:hypothetical protein
MVLLGILIVLLSQNGCSHRPCLLSVLAKYELYEFVPLVDGMRKGDLRKFNDALVDFQDRFIR